ncbi:hypothetical protein [Alloyangia pacifica]|uniref:hypothetical protein n=1 Tax=Alloyangia pacifica TaxID=311180 RepID=UPI001CD70E09|nr:hypothetical protein [Alloyangia pacifica]MCA0995878.1 hypothetical protein [Alloyangia pacifica]
MRRLARLGRLCGLLWLCAGPLQAGAWLQERGAGFASSTTRLTWPQSYGLQGWQLPSGRYDTLYVEYGLSPRVTIGADLGRAISGAGKSLLFLRLPLIGAGPMRLSAELGGGRIEGHQALRPGLSLGLSHARGWLNADILAELRGTAGTDVKMDLTLGLNLPQRRKAILQVQTGVQRGDPGFVRLAPSVVLPLRERLQAEIGASWGLVGDTSAGLLLGLWTQF